MISIDSIINGISSTVFTLSSVDLNEPKEQVEKLLLYVATHKDLHYISFKNRKISSIDWERVLPIFNAIKLNKNILSVGFTDASLHELNEAELVKLLHCLKISQIKRLVISQDDLYKSPILVKFFSALAKIGLDSLELDSNRLGDLIIRDFHTIIEKLLNSKLSSLTLTRNSIGGIQHMKAREDNEDSDELDCYTLLTKLFNSNLREIDLSSNSISSLITAEGWGALFKSIDKNKVLKKLGMYNCGFELLEQSEGKEFVELLVDFVANTHLEELNLSCNDFSKETTTKLIAASLKNKTLNLVLNETSLGKKEIKDLKAELQGQSQKTAAAEAIASNMTKDPVILSQASSEKVQLPQDVKILSENQNCKKSLC